MILVILLLTAFIGILSAYASYKIYQNFAQNRDDIPTPFVAIAGFLILLVLFLLGIYGDHFLYSTPFRLGLFFLVLSLNSLVLSLSFIPLQRLGNKSIRFFYFLGFALLLLFSWVYFLDSQSMEYYSINTFLYDLIDIPMMIIFSSLGLCVVFWSWNQLLGFLGKSKPFGTRRQNQILDHYRQHGLSDTEIQFFRQEMGVAKERILILEDIYAETAKVRIIIAKYNSLKVCKDYFRKIVQSPRKLDQASTFLYEYLPSLVDLVDKYNEINGHLAKNKQSYQILERTAQTIDQLCEKINDHYIQFNQDVFEDLSDELHFTESKINRQDKLFDDEATVDDLIQADLNKAKESKDKGEKND